MVSFGQLYGYQTKNGVVIPQTSSIKATIENKMKEIFGADMSIAPETPAGRLVEALTLMFVDVLGVNAQNANNFNPETAVGSYLDSLGKLWGVARFEEESDNDYRSRILASQSRGNGFPESIRQAISQVDGASGCVILNNGHKDVANINGVRVEGHSIYACVDCENTDAAKLAVANAIRNSISAGCGCTDLFDSGNGIRVPASSVAPTGWPSGIVFYMPEAVNASIYAKVKSGNYTGTDIISDAKAAIQDYIGKHKMNTVVSAEEIVSAISMSSGIMCTDFEIYLDGDTSAPVESITLMPSQVLRIADGDITVTV